MNEHSLVRLGLPLCAPRDTIDFKVLVWLDILLALCMCPAEKAFSCGSETESTTEFIKFS